MNSTSHPISVAFLSACPPIEAYKWLENSWRKPKAGGYSFSERCEIEEKARTAEYILCRRNDYLIDLGLAQFACSSFILQRVFKRRGIVIRCAVLANPCLFTTSLGHEAILDIKTIIGLANKRELKSIAGNPYLPVEFYENLLERTEYFSEITDKDYMLVLIELGKNPRITTEYNGDFMDGWAEYKYNSIFSKAWELIKVLPATQKWAYALNSLLQNAILPIDFKGIPEALKRWEIDNSIKENESCPWPGESYFLRSRIADLLPADEALLVSTDSALRRSFYRRFSPEKFRNWQGFAAIDGKVFLEEAIPYNMQLWHRKIEREILSKLAWEYPDSRSNMVMPNLYKGVELKLMQHHPEWFAEKPA